MVCCLLTTHSGQCGRLSCEQQVLRLLTEYIVVGATPIASEFVVAAVAFCPSFSIDYHICYLYSIQNYGE